MLGDYLPHQWHFLIALVSAAAGIAWVMHQIKNYGIDKEAARAETKGAAPARLKVAGEPMEPALAQTHASRGRAHSVPSEGRALENAIAPPEGSSTDATGHRDELRNGTDKKPQLSHETLAQFLKMQEQQAAQLASLEKENSKLRSQLDASETERAAHLARLQRENTELQTQRDTLQVERDALSVRLNNEVTELQVRLTTTESERDHLAKHIEFLNSANERAANGLPHFLVLQDPADPIARFWFRGFAENPRLHARLEGALRSYKIANDDDDAELGGRLLELVNDVGLHLYNLMQAMNFDETQKREEAVRWHEALNKDGRGRFSILIPWAGTPFDAAVMTRRDQRDRSDRVQSVFSWGVRDKSGRTARRALVQ
jgi:hypothetical protein